MPATKKTHMDHVLDTWGTPARYATEVWGPDAVHDLTPDGRSILIHLDRPTPATRARRLAEHEARNGELAAAGRARRRRGRPAPARDAGRAGSGHGGADTRARARAHPRRIVAPPGDDPRDPRYRPSRGRRGRRRVREQRVVVLDESRRRDGRPVARRR